MSRVKNGLALWVAFLLIASAARAQTILEYGSECAAKIAPIPAFDCRAGKLMLITVNGQLPPVITPNMTCDRPALLPYSEPGAQGQCIPLSRVLVLRDDQYSQVIAVCREKTIKPTDTYLFDEVDIIEHSVTSGSTCWFQALAPPPLSPSQGLDGRRVPPPNEATPPPNRPSALTFWNSPQVTAAAKCVDCHDSDPFMYTPFIAQTGQLPKDPFGKYTNDIGAAFQSWPKPFGITTAGNTCVGCHRIGSLVTCHTTIKQAVGLVSSPGEDSWAKEYPHAVWMPPGNPLKLVTWKITYDASVRELTACCNNPDSPGCKRVPIKGALSISEGKVKAARKD